jgi:hypothetical protein
MYHFGEASLIPEELFKIFETQDHGELAISSGLSKLGFVY